MQKNDKMQIGQNAKVLNINNPKYSILGVPIENQCVKGGGLLYGGFGLPIFGIFCILSGLHFVCFDVLSHLHFVKFAFCHGFINGNNATTLRLFPCSPYECILCDHERGSVLAGAGLGTPPPPLQKVAKRIH